ncbi:MAG: hypothetical protein LBT20_01820 [Clostridiales bacterium]|jgi:hypothetical protein|nr:hypothetical protein [Clostridiales bacterium]
MKKVPETGKSTAFAFLPIMGVAVVLGIVFLFVSTAFGVFWLIFAGGIIFAGRNNGMFYTLTAQRIVRNGKVVPGKVVRVEDKLGIIVNGVQSRKYKIHFEYYPDGNENMARSSSTEWLSFTVGIAFVYSEGKRIRVAYTPTNSVILKEIYNETGARIYSVYDAEPQAVKKTAEKSAEPKAVPQKPAPQKPAPIVPVLSLGGVQKDKKEGKNWGYVASLPDLMAGHEEHRGKTGVQDEAYTVEAQSPSDNAYAEIARSLNERHNQLTQPTADTVNSEHYTARRSESGDAYSELARVAEERFAEPTQMSTGYADASDYLQRQTFSAPSIPPIDTRGSIPPIYGSKPSSYGGFGAVVSETVGGGKLTLTAIENKYDTVEILFNELGMSRYDVRMKIEGILPIVFDAPSEKVEGIQQKLEAIGTKTEV